MSSPICAKLDSILVLSAERYAILYSPFFSCWDWYLKRLGMIDWTNVSVFTIK